MPKILAQLKSLKDTGINPNPEWVARNRALLLSQIKNTVSKEAPNFAFENVWSWLAIFMPRNMVYAVVRPVAVLVIVAMVGTSGAIAAVDASYEALPGDFLYGAARAAQKTQVAVASLIGGKSAEAKARVKVVQSLAAKTQKIVKINDGKKAERLAIAVADLKSEISTISSNLDDSQVNTASSIKSDVVKDVANNSGQIKNVLQEVKNDLLTSTSTADLALTQQVNDVTNSTKDLSVKALGVLVANHANGDKDTSTDDVKSALVTAAQVTATDAGVSKQNVDGVKTMVDGVKNEIKDIASDASKKNSTSTPVAAALVTQINNVSNQTVAAVIKTEVVTHEVTQKASEAEQFAQNGDFQKAIDKIKEASDASKVAEKISDATLVKAQAVAPVVQVIKDGNMPVVVTIGGPVTGVFDVSSTNTAMGVVMVTTTPKFSTTTATVKYTTNTPEKK